VTAEADIVGDGVADLALHGGDRDVEVDLRVRISEGRDTRNCLVVDGEWMPDPLARATVPNPFGGQNSVLNVKGRG